MTKLATLFDLLTADARRRLLVTLCDVESVGVPEGLLTRGTVGAVAPTSHPTQAGASPSSASVEEIELYHVHLPKLEAEGIIEWDREADVVSRGPSFETVEPTVRLLATNNHVLPEPFF